MVSVATFSKKSRTELENIREYNEEKVKQLLLEIEVIDTILAEKSEDEIVKDGYYLVDRTQSIIANIFDGKIYQVYDANNDFRINRQIAVRFEKGEMVCQLKGKKRKLTFMLARNFKFSLTESQLGTLVRANNETYMNNLTSRFEAFLNYKTTNKEINKTKDVFIRALEVLNNELNANYTFDRDSLFKFLDLKFVKDLIEYHDVRLATIYKVLKLIQAIKILNGETFTFFTESFEDNLKRYEKESYKTDFEDFLENIVKIPEVNL